MIDLKVPLPLHRLQAPQTEPSESQPFLDPPMGGFGGPLVFPIRGGKPFATTTLSELLRELKIAAVPHGFRSSFRDWAAEETDHP